MRVEQVEFVLPLVELQQMVQVEELVLSLELKFRLIQLMLMFVVVRMVLQYLEEQRLVLELVLLLSRLHFRFQPKQMEQEELVHIRPYW